MEVQVAVKTQRGAPRSRLGKRPAHFCQGELWTTVEVEQEAPASREAYDFGHSALLLAYVVIFGFFHRYLERAIDGRPGGDLLMESSYAGHD